MIPLLKTAPPHYATFSYPIPAHSRTEAVRQTASDVMNNAQAAEVTMQTDDEDRLLITHADIMSQPPPSPQVPFKAQAKSS